MLKIATLFTDCNSFNDSYAIPVYIDLKFVNTLFIVTRYFCMFMPKEKVHTKMLFF